MGLRSARTMSISSSTQKSPGNSKKNKNKNSSTLSPTRSTAAKKVRKSAKKSNGASSFPPTKSESLESSVSVTTDHEESLPSGRPKRKAASSVRYGSYKDSIDNVDFSLMVDSFASTTSATTGGEELARSKSSSSGSKRKPSKSPKKSTTPVGVRVKRNALMTSKTSKSKTVQPSPKEHQSFAPKCATSDQQRPARLRLTTLLPPVLIERYRGDITPDMLRSVSSNTKIDIFNRKTGRIMRGEDGVYVKDLVQALRDHAEYEPIFPCPKRAKKENTYRQSRSSANARVSEGIQPQSMIRESTIEGRHVLVTGGPHKGLIGEVYACIPGNWYMITDISNPEDFDYIIHSKNLKVVNRIKHAPVSSGEESTGLPNGKEGTNTGATSKSPSGHGYSLPAIAQDILSLRRKNKELEEERSGWKRKVDAHNGEEEEAIVHQQMVQNMRAFERVQKALEETQSELQTKIFLHEILRSSQM